ncbi:unnamed protein product, partial [Prunus brigantina]
ISDSPLTFGAPSILATTRIIVDASAIDVSTIFLPYPIGLKATASPGFTFSAHRPTESPDVMKDGSSKRFRYEDFAPPEGDDGGMDQSDQIPSMPEVNFKDKLLSYSCFEYIEGMEKDGFSIESGDYEVEDSPYGHSIRSSEHVKNKIYIPWRNSMIIQFVRKTHTYNFIFARLKQRWRIKGPMQLVDLDNGFFIVHFVLEEDLLYVLTGGPWLVARQYAVVKKWRPNFCAAKAHVSRITVWVRLSGMGVEFFNYETIKCIGDLIGSSYKVDVHIDNETDIDMAGDIQEEMRSHQVEKLRKMRLNDNQRGLIDPIGDKDGFGIWNVIPSRKVWKKNFENGTTASEDKGKGFIPENDCFDGEQEHVFGTLENLLSINGKAIQSKDNGGWNDLTPPNKGKENVGRPGKVLFDISNKYSSRSAIVLRPSSKNLAHDSTITSVSELD